MSYTPDMVAAVDRRDARATATVILLHARAPHRTPRDVMAEATAHAAEMTARSLVGGDSAAAQTYASAWDLLNDREMRLYARRTRGNAARREATL